MKTLELGIFGGTFDPIHNGHIHSVIETASHLDIPEVLLLPAHIPPHKTSVVASSEHRLAMAKMVCEHHALLTCDARELKNNTPSYTAATLADIHLSYPQHKLYFFIGMDSFITFTTWYKWQDILKQCHLVVSSRPNYSLEDINQETQSLLNQHQAKTISALKTSPAGKIYLYNQPAYCVSSTNIRQQLLQTRDRLNDVPTYIAQYIQEHQLYLEDK
ncbi:nicotinate-nucleotide adenylyltransferase [Thalassotalea piscium]